MEVICPNPTQKHVLITPEMCPCNKQSDHPCPVCDGGLAICAACGKAEADLDEPCDAPAQGAKGLVAAAAPVPAEQTRNDVYLEAIQAVEAARDEWDAKGRKHWYAEVAQEVIGVLRARAALPPKEKD